MIQDIIALVIVFGAVVYTIVNMIRLFDKKNESACNCGSCDLKSGIEDLKMLKKH